MYLGYVKAGRLDETDQLYKSKLEVLKVQKVFSDSKYDTTALKELLGYVRQGDSIVVESILDLSISAGEFIELAIKEYDYRVGVQTKIGDIKIDVWCQLAKELIERSGEEHLYQRLFNWEKEHNSGCIKRYTWKHSSA